MAFSNKIIWPSPLQSSNASFYVIYWSGAVISTAAIWRKVSTGRMNKSLMGLLLLMICQQLGSVPSSANVLETRVVTMSSALRNLNLLTTSNGRRGLKTKSVEFWGSKGFQYLMSPISKILLMLRIFSISLSSWWQFFSLLWFDIVASTTGTDSEQFLKSVVNYECGRRDINIIRSFY